MQTILLLKSAFLCVFRFFGLSSFDTVTTLILSRLASFLPFLEVIPEILYNSGTWGTTVEEQANVCLALLKGYSASFIDHGEKQQHVQEVLRRCWDTLDTLPSSLLKLRLLTACYGEVFDEPLADEGRSIIASWSVASLTAEQQEAVDEFQNVVDNPYPWEEME